MSRIRGLGLLLAAVSLLVCGTVGAVPLQEFDVSCNIHPEYPKASGSVTATNGAWRIHYDFSEGGHAVAMVIVPKEPIWADAIGFEAWHRDSSRMGVMVCDSTGQCFWKVADSAPGGWRRFRCELGSVGWLAHWGGANDGMMRLPLKKIELSVDRLNKGKKVPTEVGDAWVRNLVYAEAKGRRKADSEAHDVVYSMTDFHPGDMFSGGPRILYRSDTRTPYPGGPLEIDFSRQKEMSLVGGIPVWGSLTGLRLTVDVQDESAEVEFELDCRSIKIPCGTPVSSTPLPSGWIRRVYVMRESLENVARVRCIQKLIVRRGNPRARMLSVHPVELEAFVRPGEEQPPLVAIPPAGEVSPSVLEVGYLNLGSDACLSGVVQVTARDWEGRMLSRSAGVLPMVRPGHRAFVKVEIPPVAANLNFVSYRCDLLDGGKLDHGVCPWKTSWTRPLTDKGDPRPNPDLPWGFGVYLHRNEDRHSYGSAYESRTNETADAEMEKIAAMAQAAGIKWERAEFRPDKVDLGNGEYDFSFFDRVQTIAARYGLSCLALWSHFFPGREKWYWLKDSYSNDTYTAYVEGLRAAVQRYRGRLKNWEIWNEPNCPNAFWCGPQEDYPVLVTKAWSVLKAVDPENRVVACSTSGIHPAFMDMCIREGMKFDDISVHPYRERLEERRFLSDLASVTNRSRGTKTWLTEIGWPTGCDKETCSEIEQAAYLARAYMTAAGSGAVKAVFGYDFIDDGFNVRWREDNFGVVRRDYTPKPAYRGIAKVCRTFVTGAPTIRPIPLSDVGVDAWVFRMGGKSAVWASAPVSVRVTTSSPGKVTNLMDEILAEHVESIVIKVGPERIVFFDMDVQAVTLVKPRATIDF